MILKEEMIFFSKVNPHYSEEVITMEVWNENQLYLICYDGSFWCELLNSHGEARPSFSEP